MAYIHLIFGGYGMVEHIHMFESRIVKLGNRRVIPIPTKELDELEKYTGCTVRLLLIVYRCPESTAVTEEKVSVTVKSKRKAKSKKIPEDLQKEILRVMYP